MSNLIPFSFESKEIRTITENGEPWVVAKDVAEVLGYKWHHNIISNVPSEWKGSKRITTPGGAQNLWCLSEQGLYFFLARSDKPKALPFQKWIAGEVLPSIRKTGKYEIRAQFQRESARLEYRPMTDALQEERKKLGKKTSWFHFANEADLLNRVALGMTSAEFKAFHNIGRNDSLRDYLTEAQIKCMTDLQRANTVFLSMGMDFHERKDQLKRLFERNHHDALIAEHFRITA